MSKTNKELVFWIVFWGSALVAFYVRLVDPDLTWFNTHMSRDLARAFEWLDLRPYSMLGPEMNHGHRLPGPAFYFILAGCWTLVKSVTGVLTLLHLLTIILAVVFTLRVVRPLGRTPALVFWLLFSLMPTQVLLSRTLWNPSLVVAVNLGYLLCLDQYHRHRGWGALVCFYLVGLVGIQVHLSTLLGLVAGTLWLRLQQGRWLPLSLLGLGMVLTYWGAIWGMTDGYAAYFKALEKQYVFLGWGAWETTEFHWDVFLRSIYYHVFISLRPLGDYELYSLVPQFGPELLPRYAWLQAFASLGYAFVVVLLGSLVYLSARLIKRKGLPLEQLLAIWLVVGMVVLYCYRIKDGIFPYRYGMTFYPVQFLLPVLALRAVRSFKIRALAVLFALVVFAGNAFFLGQCYRLMELTARASQSPDISFEMALRYKLQVLKKVDLTGAPQEFFSTLHGGAANRLRTFEFDNWDQQRWTGGLSQSLLRSGVTVSPDPAHYLVTFPAAGQSGLQYLALTPAHLPPGASLIYYDREDRTLGWGYFAPDEVLLPVLSAPPETRALEVRFQLPACSATRVEAWYDGHLHHRVLELEQVWLNEAEVPIENHPGGWLDQHFTTFQASPEEVSCRMRFRVYRTGSYSRLDIFRRP